MIKKVLIISPTLFFGGGEVFIAEVFPRLEGVIDIYYWVSNKQLYNNLETSQKVLDVSLVFFKSISKINLFIDKNKIDYVILNGNRAIYMSAFLKSYVYKIAYKHTSVKSVNGLFKTFLYKILINFNFIYSNKIVCVSNSIANEHLRFKKKLKVIYNGINTQIMKKDYKRRNEMLEISFVGRLEVSKGIWDAIYSLERLSSKYSFVFNIIGTGSQMNSVTNYIKSKGLKNFIIYGHVNDVKSYLQTTDIFLLPSYYESFGISICEAMALGIPVVSSNVGGIPEIVINEKHGYLITPKNIAEIYSALEILICNKELRLDMGKEARRQIVEKFPIEQTMKNVLSLFNNC
ncbi:glycosyltransferase family 4 protein [Arcticibacter eurypsychrophilus]|uniref:glycosyltransferase family 4 protein n=1 Tax=Arcticibacter eurypsychrophilus TaxID=1434752 RepID=UPI00084DD8AD|nr:glycosyltransferase family 4 protein [Arcticibacter eurypsychrophilus]